MDQTVNISVGAEYTIVQAIPGCASSDTVTIEIRRASDSYTWDFDDEEMTADELTGAMEYLSGSLWKQSFTPPTDGTYIVTIHDAEVDVDYYQTLVAITITTPTAVVTPSATSTTATAMLTAVNAAITARLSGGGVQSYSIGNRNLQYMTLTELYEFRKQLMREVNLTSRKPRTNLVTFGNPR